MLSPENGWKKTTGFQSCYSDLEINPVPVGLLQRTNQTIKEQIIKPLNEVVSVSLQTLSKIIGFQ